MSKASYEGLRHMFPELVMTIRGALDVGVKKSVIMRIIKKHSATEDVERVAIEAVKYMQENLDAGAVCWRDGTYSFIEHVAGRL